MLTLASGAPYDPTYYFEGDFNGSGEGFGRLDLVGNPYAGTSMPGNILNLQAFHVPCTWDAGTGACVPGTQHFGNVGPQRVHRAALPQFRFLAGQEHAAG